MKATEGKIGRVFVLRLEDGDVVPESIERFAADKNVKVGFCLLVGGIGSGQVVVGPRETQARPPDPMQHGISDAHEVAAVGVLAPGLDGKPGLHIHGALGRSGTTVSGCLRQGVKTWVTGEVILYEVTGTEAVRVLDPSVGFALLEPLGAPAVPAGAAASAPTPSPAPRPQPAAVPAAAAGGGNGKHAKVLYLFNAEVH